MLAILCCILDSRGDQHKELVDSAKKYCHGADVLIYRDYQELPTVERYCRAYETFRNHKYTHYMFGASDLVIDTNNFDRIIMGITNQEEKKNKHRIFVLQPDDGVHGIKLCTHPIFTTEFLDATGEFFPRGFMRHSYVDNYIMHIARKTKTLLYCPDLKLIHNHSIASDGTRGKNDEHYEKVYKKEYLEEDLNQYTRLINEYAPKIIKKINLHKRNHGYNVINYFYWKKFRDLTKAFRMKNEK